jgi:hypothetical protein
MQNESNRRSLSKISKLLRSARSGRFNTLSLPGLTRTARRFAVYVWPALEPFLTARPEALVKVHGEETDLALFDLQVHAYPIAA